MTAVVAGAGREPAGFPVWAVRWAPWLLLALHVPFVVAAPLFTLTRHAGFAPTTGTLLVALALVLGGLQLRHSLAASRGERPAGWAWTFLAILVLAYVPVLWIGWDWTVMEWFVVASAAMVLRGRLAALVVAAPLLVTSAVAAVQVAISETGTPGQAALWGAYELAILSMGGIALYGSARLVRVLDELYAARIEMAELAVGRERLRVSRDLHDLLGQSLSAVSLKGDLALRLLATDERAARAEIESLTGVARGALRDVRAVARDEHAVTLRAEIDAAAALLGAAGIDVDVQAGVGDLPPRVEEALAWAVREGATNLLRHSEATACSITAGRCDGVVRLEVVNDGVRGPAGEGRGLAGLAERARELSGSLHAGATGDGRFRLVVEIPQERA